MLCACGGGASSNGHLSLTPPPCTKEHVTDDIEDKENEEVDKNDE